MFHYMHITHHTIILNQNRSFRNKQASKNSTISPSISLRLRSLAQARCARSGEPPPRLGESTKKRGMSNTGSRLSEIPLAWASCLLAQKLSESPRRPFVPKT